MRNKWHLTYIDLFAGPGRCLIEDPKEEIEGSPLISLAYDFHRYIFVEKDKNDIRALQQRCQKSPKRSEVEIIEGNCNEKIDKIKPKLKGLVLAFIDPTGIDIHFNTVRALVDNRRVDLLINIQFGMDIKRGFEIYQKQKNNSKLSLFLGDNINWDKINTPQDVIKLYKQRIKDLGYSTVEFKDITVKNRKNVPMYFLFFASKHPRGLEFWKKITTKDDLGQLELL